MGLPGRRKADDDHRLQRVGLDRSSIGRDRPGPDLRTLPAGSSIADTPPTQVGNRRAERAVDSHTDVYPFHGKDRDCASLPLMILCARALD